MFRSRTKIFADFCRKPPVLILSAGKVGSTSLYRALLDQYPGLTIRMEKLPPEKKPVNIRLPHLHGHYKADFCDYLLARYVHGTLPAAAAADTDDNRLKIITPIREPIGRNVAAFYETRLQRILGARPLKSNPLKHALASRLPILVKDRIKRGIAALPADSRLHRRLVIPQDGWLYKDEHIKQIQNLDPPQLRQMFLQRYDAQFFAIDWFDNCVKKYLSLDVYEQPFPDEKVAYYCLNQADMMILESSLPNATKAQRVQDFLGLDAFEMGYRKVTAEKTRAIADSYALFKNEVKLPGWHLDKMLGSKFFRHFYTKEDAERLRQRWSE